MRSVQCIKVNTLQPLARHTYGKAKHCKSLYNETKLKYREVYLEKIVEMQISFRKQAFLSDTSCQSVLSRCALRTTKMINQQKYYTLIFKTVMKKSMPRLDTFDLIRSLIIRRDTTWNYYQAHVTFLFLFLRIRRHFSKVYFPRIHSENVLNVGSAFKITKRNNKSMTSQKNLIKIKQVSSGVVSQNMTIYYRTLKAKKQTVSPRKYKKNK